MKGVLVVCLWACIVDIAWSQDPLVMTSQGLVRGTFIREGNYSEFLGIPYAAINPDNPFGDALPAPKFQDVFDAHHEGAYCPQRDEFTYDIIGHPDCLHVNVYVPSSASSRNKLPVMAWIYGGHYEIGFAGQYVHGPQYLMKHDVILVTLNYRLGVFGFMCLDIPSVPGNSGLKDQQTALRWIQDNIEAFGGNKDSVTIFGESAGSGSVEFHMLSPGSSGLFHRSIMQSGVTFTTEMMTPSIPTAPIDLAKQMGFNPETIEEALNLIKDADIKSLVRAREDAGLMFGACVEKEFDGVNGFLMISTQHVLESGEYNKVPFIQGFNSEEQLGHLNDLIHDSTYLLKYQNIVYETLSTYFNFKSQEQLATAANLVNDYYFGKMGISAETIKEFIMFDTDIRFYNPTERSLSYHLANSVTPIYKYVFDYSGDINFAKHRMNLTEGGAAHADDIGYIFKQKYLPDEISSADQLIVDRMTTMWTNFAKYGNPTPEVTELLPVRWEPVTQASRNFLLIDTEMKLDQKPFHERMAFWDLFFEAYGEYYWMV